MTDTYQTIITKRDTRKFDGRAIPDDVLNRLVQAARMAGSAKAAEPVRLILVRDQAQKNALAECGQFTPHIPTCAVAAVFVLVPEFGEVGTPFTLFRGPFDAGRAAQNLMLAAWSEDIASCPASMHYEEKAREVLNLPPGHIVANVIALGYPATEKDATTGTRPRMPVDDFVFHERWGG